MNPQDANLLTIDQAVKFINDEYKKDITSGNLNYLIKYGQIFRHLIDGSVYLSVIDIQEYYNNNDETKWKEKIDEKLNWELSFTNVKEYERTKHVHRLHPYKGKFIPQLVDYFLNQKVNGIKKEVFFSPGDIVIDPFCGSGTTLVQANELGIHAIGIDVSEFNALMSNIKVREHNLLHLQNTINELTRKLKIHFEDDSWKKFDKEFSGLLSEFNKNFFPTPEILYKIKKGEINIEQYSKEKVKIVIDQYNEILKIFKLNIFEPNPNKSYINKWFTPPVKNEIIFLVEQINKIDDEDLKQILRLILSRTVRSCRATTHSDLATLVEPVYTPYYCYKHNKICKPLFSLSYWWEFYSNDTVKRLSDFSKLRTSTSQYCITGDSRNIDISQSLREFDINLYTLLNNKKAKGIFTSPPYVGLIDYHEQHAYAYELFNIQRKDNLEIGSMSNGKGRYSREKYIEDISLVLRNSLKFLVDDCEIFIVANDNYNLYPEIAEKSSLLIVEEFLRPVLNRTEKDKSKYSEKIFRLHKKEGKNEFI